MQHLPLPIPGWDDWDENLQISIVTTSYFSHLRDISGTNKMLDPNNNMECQGVKHLICSTFWYVDNMHVYGVFC